MLWLACSDPVPANAAAAGSLWQVNFQASKMGRQVGCVGDVLERSPRGCRWRLLLQQPQAACDGWGVACWSHEVRFFGLGWYEGAGGGRGGNNTLAGAMAAETAAAGCLWQVHSCLPALRAVAHPVLCKLYRQAILAQHCSHGSPASCWWSPKHEQQTSLAEEPSRHSFYLVQLGNCVLTPSVIPHILSHLGNAAADVRQAAAAATAAALEVRLSLPEAVFCCAVDVWYMFRLHRSQAHPSHDEPIGAMCH